MLPDPRGPVGDRRVRAVLPQARRPNGALLATLASLGRQIGQAIERARAEGALRDSIARKSAILDAAFDCIITMDGEGRVVEVNAATERTFGYRAEAMVGLDLADLIVPEHLREAHRRGVRRYLETGHGRMLDHPLELDGQRADGSLFPVEVAITQPALGGPPLFTGFVRDVTDRRRADEALRALADEQAALRRVATLVASEGDPRQVFSAVTEEVGRLLGAQSADMVRYEGGEEASVVGAWSAHGAPAVPVGGTISLDGDTASAVVRRTGRPVRIDAYDGVPGTLAERCARSASARAVAAPITLGGAAVGRLLVARARREPLRRRAPRAGSRDFAELVAQALANAEAREQLAASRARIVEAGDDERRRLERNLHDGAQQRLVALALTLRMAPSGARRDDRGTRGLLAEARDGARAGARGAARARPRHPPGGADRARPRRRRSRRSPARAPVPVDLGGDARRAAAGAGRGGRLLRRRRGAHERRQVRRASAARVDGQPRRRRAAWSRSPTTASAAPMPRRGTGLRGLADRVEALRRPLDVSSPEGSGTTLRATLPCAPA